MCGEQQGKRVADICEGIRSDKAVSMEIEITKSSAFIFLAIVFFLSSLFVGTEPITDQEFMVLLGMASLGFGLGFSRVN